MVVIASVTFVAIVGPGLFSAVRTEQPATTTPTPPTQPPYATIAGTYTAMIEPHSNLPAHGMTGWWSLELTNDGFLSISAPPRFTPSVSRASFELRRNRFRTNLFANTVCKGTSGTYEWALSEGRLRFTTLRESCRMREAIFGARQWGHVGAMTISSSPASEVPFLPDDGSTLAPGAYTTEFQPPMTFTVSDGWTGNSDTGDFVDIRMGRSDAAGALTFFGIEKVFDARTHHIEPLPKDLESWFTSHPALRIISTPQPTTLGGVMATQFDVKLAPGWSCGKDTCVEFAPLSPGEPHFGWATNAASDLRARIFLLSVRGNVVVVEFASARDRFPEGVKVAEDILSTIKFG